MKKKIYIIAGPTASGKTKLAIDLAIHKKGEIINADSLQVYQDVPILTARPTETEQQSIPHHLFGFLDAFAVDNVQSWLNKASLVVENIETPIFVGGTGMYIKMLTEGISPIPDIPEEIRQQVRSMTKEEVLSHLGQTELLDIQRQMRALEVKLATGKDISYFQSLPKLRAIDADFKVILIMPEREKLYLRCNYRFDEMIKQGALKQVSDLYDKNNNMTGGVFQAIGVKDLISFMKGEQPLQKAIDHSKQLTRNYAKRQLTWFRHQLKSDVTVSLPELNKDILSL